MITEKCSIKSEVIYDDTKKHRLVLKRIWDVKKPSIAVLMLHGCSSNLLTSDLTTSLVINNAVQLEDCGGVHVLNLYSILANKLNFQRNSDDELNHKDNDAYIIKSAQECSKIILAWGKTQDTNQRIGNRAVKVINLLMPYADKVYCISDGERKMIHPLCPAVRSKWILEKVDILPKDEVK